MSDTKHTPGPWKSRCLNGEEPGMRVYKSGVEIATCHYGAPLDHNEAQANAILVAAAPDLLAASRKWIAHYDEFVRDTYLWGDDEPGIAELRAAIAKAVQP